MGDRYLVTPFPSAHVVWEGDPIRFYRTRCGLSSVSGTIADDIPLGQRTCESCLRLRAWDRDRPQK